MSVRIITGDALAEVRKLPDESVHCCVTSPPYYGLRDYGTAQWDGGDAECDHLMPSMGVRDRGRDRAASGGSFHDSPVANQIRRQFSRACGKCGARRIDRQIGLEQSPDEYVDALVSVFREVRRVLRADGTLWLNLGDTYSGASAVGWWPGNPAKNGGNSNRDGIGSIIGCKPKDLIGIPWLVAFALRADGWYLRSEIIWAKPNPMPESVTDRPTKAHEQIFLLSKSAAYYYDAAAIAEPSAYPGDERHLITDRTIEFARPDGGSRFRTAKPNAESRNKRTIWTVATAPYSEAHFATFPPRLIESCILAGCPAVGTVLDPFAGAGTTGLVADRLGRNAILIELNPSYAEMARRRIINDGPLFAEVAAE